MEIQIASQYTALQLFGIFFACGALYSLGIGFGRAISGATK